MPTSDALDVAKRCDGEAYVVEASRCSGSGDGYGDGDGSGDGDGKMEES